MDTLKLIAFTFIIIFSACNSSLFASSTDKLTSYEAKGNLESPNPVDCVSIDKLSNRMNPVDIFIGLRKCMTTESYANAAELYYAGMAYGYYDTLRVSDKTAHQAISVLRLDVFGSLSQEALNDFQTALTTISEDNRKICTSLESIGKPKYKPIYMIQHGMGVFTGTNNNDGLVKGFNTKVSWRDTLATIANCGDRATKLIKVNTYFEKGEEIWFKSHWGDQLVKEADSKTFRPLRGGWGVDASKVFYTEEFVNGANPDTFEVIDFNTGKDDSNVYRAGTKCEICDADTFEELGDNWYKDKNYVFHRMQRLLDADPATFVVLSDWFAKDKRFAYENSMKIIGADAETFKLKKCGISKVNAQDKNRCYLRGEAIPCDCSLNNSVEFPFVFQPIPDSHAHVRLIGQNKYFINNVAGKIITASLNAFVPAGLHDVEYSCKIEESKKTKHITTRFNFVEGRVYSIEDIGKQEDICDSEILPNTWFQGQNTELQVSIKFQNPKRRDWGTSWSVTTELPTSKINATLVCRRVTKKAMYENERNIIFKPLEGHLYEGKGYWNETEKTCEMRLIDLTLDKEIL